MPGLAMENANGIASGNEAPDQRHNQPSVESSSIDRRGQEVPNHGVPNILDRVLSALPPELIHVTLGFFPFAQLICRVVQQSWIELNDLFQDIGDSQLLRPAESSNLALPRVGSGGKPQSDKLSEYVFTKTRLLEFVQSKRADFIKLLVLSEWSKHADEVSRLIDIQSFIHSQYGVYEAALLEIGNMKHDLIGAQLGNPDIQTALEVLSAFESGQIPGLQFLSPAALTPLQIFRTLRRINRLIDIRLILHESVPLPFRTYLVHDGRVTFIVPSEFEIDLSVAFETHSTQFFFVDMRFLFSPSSFPRGRLRTILDQKVNSTLMETGLVGCYNFLHNLVLTHKVTILFKQAVDLLHTHWLEHLSVELLHRTLIVHYWSKKPGPKSWIEIGVRSSLEHETLYPETQATYLHLRWIRDNEEVDTKGVDFNLDFLDIESILFSVISLHITHILRNIFDTLWKSRLYGPDGLYLGMNASSLEPGLCYLDVQLIKTGRLRVKVEVVSGDTVFQMQPPYLRRFDTDVKFDAGAADDPINRISKLRCIAAITYTEYRAKAAGWLPLSVKRISPESLRQTFPANALRSMLLFRAKSWQLPWLVAFTSTMDGDNWWVARLRVQTPFAVPDDRTVMELEGAKLVTNWSTGVSGSLLNSSFSTLMDALAGMIMVQSNIDYLHNLGSIHYFPSDGKLSLRTSLRVPDIFFRFRRQMLSANTPMLFSQGRLRQRFQTIRISYKGIDYQSGSAITVADGQLATSIGAFLATYTKFNQSIAFLPRGDGFSMIFSTPVGLSVIPSLIDRLQRIDSLVSVAEWLEKKGYKIVSISLSKIRFAYPTEDELLASIEFSYEDGTKHGRSPPALTPRNPRPQLSIDFSQRNPQRRIRESLTSIMNYHRCGFVLVVELLRVTLPLLRALEQICMEACAGKSACFRTEFAARSAQKYQIRYPFLRYHFQLNASQRKGCFMWVLSNFTSPHEKLKHSDLENWLQNHIYNSRSHSWRGINEGGIATSENVAQLVSDLDKIVKSYIEQITRNGPHDKFSFKPGQNTGPGPGRFENGQAISQVSTSFNNKHASKESGMGEVTVKRTQNASGIDVITID